MDLPDGVLELAQQQRVVITRRALLDAGVTAKQLRWQMGRTWRLVLPGVVMLDWGLPDAEQRCIAALQYAGPQSWLSGPTAAEIHGLSTAQPAGPTYVLVPAPQRPREVGWLSVRRTHITTNGS